MKINILNAGYCTAPEHIAIHGGRWRTIHFPAMFALLRHPKFGAMLFDTGYSYRFFDETKKFPKRFYRWMTPVTLHEEDLVVNQLLTFDLRPKDISHVFISHFHADHIASLPDLSWSRFVYMPHAFSHLRNLPPSEDMKHAYLRGLIPTDFDSRSQLVDMSKPVLLAKNMLPSRQATTCLVMAPSSVWNCLVMRSGKWESSPAMMMTNYSSSWQMRPGSNAPSWKIVRRIK